MEEKQGFKYTPKYTCLVLSIMLSFGICLSDLIFIIGSFNNREFKGTLLYESLSISIITFLVFLISLKKQKLILILLIITIIANIVAIGLTVIYVMTATSPLV